MNVRLKSFKVLPQFPIRKPLTIFLLLLLCAPLAVQADEDAGKFVLVIDAGHGGHDPGAVGTISKEKNINLNVALAFGRLVESNCADVKVIYTRKTDVFLPLQRRVDIANQNKADLFISIHTNSAGDNKSVQGAETYTLGMARAQANLEVAKRENGVITYEAGYKETYQGFDPKKVESYIIFELMQDQYMQQSVELARLIQGQYKNHAGRNDKGVHQAGFLVLRNASMPSVLTELGFISTPHEEQYLTSEAGVRQMSQSLYNAFVKYRQQHGAPASAARTIPREKTAPEPAAKPEPAPAEADKKQRDKNTEDKQPANRKAEPEKQKPAAEKQKPATEKQKPAADKEKPTFHVQILTAERQLSETDARFKGLKPIRSYRDKGLYKYIYGVTNDYNEARRLQRTAAEYFPDCFIIALMRGERIDLQKAREINRK